MQIHVTLALSPEQRADWHAFLDQSQTAHPEQDPRFAPGWKARGFDVVYALGYRDGALRAVAMFAPHPHGLLPGFYRDAIPLGGPVCDDPRDMVAFLNGLEKRPPFDRMGALDVTPYWLDADATALSAALRAAGWQPYEPDIERSTGINDITGTLDEIVAGFSRNARRSLRKLGELGLGVEFVSGEAEAMEVFPVLSQHGSKRWGESLDPDSFLEDFRHVYGTDDLGMIAVVRQGDRILAGVICYRSRDTVIFRKSFIDDSLAAALGSVKVAPLLVKEGMKWAKARGCRVADLDGYATGLDETHRYYRIFKYKDAFRPTVAQRIVGHRKVLRPALITSSDLADRAKDRLRPLVHTLRGGGDRPQ